MKKRAKPLRRTPLRSKSSPKRSPLRSKRRVDPEWQKARKEVLKRSEGRCEARIRGCQGVANHVHHILRRSQGGKHEKENLLSVCHQCHEYIHANPKEAAEKKFLKIKKYEGDEN